MKAKPVILVVDDQIQNNELLEAYLVPEGYEIIKATSGEEALQKLADNQIDLILLDVMMPGMDGFEVTRRIRQDPKNKLMPIILVTALKETEDRIQGIKAGYDDYKQKVSELAAKIKIPIPQTFYPHSIEEVKVITERIKYPVVIKIRSVAAGLGMTHVYNARRRLLPQFVKE